MPHLRQEEHVQGHLCKIVLAQYFKFLVFSFLLFSVLMNSMFHFFMTS